MRQGKKTDHAYSMHIVHRGSDASYLEAIHHRAEYEAKMRGPKVMLVLQRHCATRGMRVLTLCLASAAAYLSGILSVLGGQGQRNEAVWSLATWVWQ